MTILRPKYEWRAKILSVTDGDTFKAYLDRGCDDYSNKKIRIQGVNCSELYHGGDRVKGAEATAKTKALLESWQANAEWPILIESVLKTSFDRLVCVVHGPSGQNLADVIIAGGWGVPFMEKTTLS
jgi:endonuclease YncB( thermonuclease family)